MPERFPPTMRDARAKIIGAARGGTTWVRFQQFEELTGMSGAAAALLVTVLDIQGHVVYHKPERPRDPLVRANEYGVVLQPEWLAKAIAILLDDPECRRNKGLISHERMGSLWQQSGYPVDVYPYFRELMERCYVSYPIAGRAESLLPQLLVGERPDKLLPWQPDQLAGDGQTQLVVIYEFYEVPRGLVPVLIVATRKFHVRNEWHWPRGTFLRDPKTGAEAVVELKARDLVITVRGRESGRFMEAITRLIEDTISAIWEGIKLDDPRGATAYVPCDGTGRDGKPCPGRLNLNFLRHELDSGDNGKCSCDKCYSKLEITQLLHGFYFEDRRLGDAIEGVHRAVRREGRRGEQRDAALLKAVVAVEKDGPCLFTLLPRRTWSPFSRSYDLTLWCEGWGDRQIHPVCAPGSRLSGDYRIKRPRTWLAFAAPAITWSLRLCRVVVPVVGEVLAQAPDVIAPDLLKRVKLAEKIVAALPKDELALGPTGALSPTAPSMPDEPALRVFHELLRTEVADKEWGGLRCQAVPGMKMRWLCASCSARATAGGGSSLRPRLG